MCVLSAIMGMVTAYDYHCQMSKFLQNRPALKKKIKKLQLHRDQQRIYSNENGSDVKHALQ